MVGIRMAVVLLMGLLWAVPVEAAGLTEQPTAQVTKEKVCLMWQQPKPEEQRLTFPGRPAGVNVVSPCWFTIASAKGEVRSIAVADMNYVRAAKKTGMKIWPLVTNSSFDPAVTHALLQNPAGRQRAARELVRLVRLYELDGLNLDFENIGAADRDGLTSFVGELTDALHAASAVVSIDVTAPSDDPQWSLCYDRPALAGKVDYLMLMGYDEHSPGYGAAGSVASLPWVEKGIRDILASGVPADKLVLGMPLYMRLWSEKDGQVKGRTLHMPEADSLWQQKKAPRKWLADIGQYYYSYEEDGTRYRVWQEDARSLALKAAFISRYDLAGAALWKKGVESSDVWPVLAAELENSVRQ